MIEAFPPCSLLAHRFCRINPGFLLAAFNRRRGWLHDLYVSLFPKVWSVRTGVLILSMFVFGTGKLGA